MKELSREELQEALRLADRVINSVKVEPTMSGSKYYLLVETYKREMEKYSNYLQERLVDHYKDKARKEGFNEALEEVNELITNILSKESYKDDYRE